MLELKSLKVKGFRAYTEEKNFTFENPVIFLFGENHCGKSSTLNAVEWCLFGSDCIGIGTGIRERKDWEIPNRNTRPPQASVEVQLEDKATGDKLAIAREWISTRKDNLTVSSLDGRTIRGEEAQKKLNQVVKSSFRDFLTTVYQHQEAIRAVLTQEPKERNDAIDRLLGLSDYRNILAWIEAAKIQRKHKKMADDFDSFSREIDVALRTRENDLKEKKEKATEEGLKENQLSEKGALEIASKAKDQLQEFASETGLSFTDLEVPQQTKDLYLFRKLASKEIKRFRSEMPGVEKQQDLYKRRSGITDLKAKYDQAKKSLDETRRKLENFAKEHGNEKAINKRKVETEKQFEGKKKELSQANAIATVKRSAIDYLKLQTENMDACPVCGKKTSNLLEHLEREWKEELEKQVGEIQKQIDELQTQLKDLETFGTEYRKLEESMASANGDVKEIRRQIGSLLEREIVPEDDCSAILNNVSLGIEKELEELEKAVKSKQESLDKIMSSLEQIQLVLDILSLEGKKRIVEQIQQSPEYLRIEELKDQIATLIYDLEKVKEAISEASYEEAKQKVAAAGDIIDGYFRRIANNPSVSKIEFSLHADPNTALNSYEFRDQNGKDLTPILSQGDLNAMALSIFLGMASSKETNQPFNFVMLDDPSQSLGLEHKEKLVEILNEVLSERMVILSSMDNELQKIALAKITKAKTRYFFSNWTPEQGPEVSKEIL